MWTDFWKWMIQTRKWNKGNEWYSPNEKNHHLKQISGSSGWLSFVIPDLWKQAFPNSETDVGITIDFIDLQQ